MKRTSYQIKVTLTGVEPPIWRRLIVPADCTMEALHCAIQTTMGWENYHLYAFETRKGRRVLRRVEIPDPDEMWDPSWSIGPKPEDSARVRLADFASPGDAFAYIYDFGDNWEHDIRVEQAMERDGAAANQVECLDGARACPPEDIGGAFVYAAVLEGLAMAEDERDEMVREKLDWMGHDWNAEAFDRSRVNRALRRWKPNMRGRMYEGVSG